MARQRSTVSGLPQALRKAALRQPGAEEGIACKGTAIECSAFKARGKTFFFLAAAVVRLKLRDSLGEATRLASKEPGRYRVGSLGWVAVSLGPEGSPPLILLERWIEESYRVVAGKQPAAMLPVRDPAAAKKKTVTRRNAKGRKRR